MATHSSDTPQSLSRLVGGGHPVAESIRLDDEGALRLGELLAFPSDRVHVRSMMNQSLDGATAGEDGSSSSLSNPWDFFMLTVLRALPDIIVCGATTVRREDFRRPSGRKVLRGEGLRPCGAELPALAILTTSGKIPPHIDETWPTLLVCPSGNGSRVARESGFSSDAIIEADGARAIVEALATRGYRGIQVEGGPFVNGMFFDDGAFDELVWTRSAITVGGEAPRASVGKLHRLTWHLSDLFHSPGACIERYVPTTLKENR
ncbi:dihydrofolate reductase family protein [Dermabacter vaginalis]|uniref:Pyrimidine reductase n=1 Tax=Dermabacter vaginalis TaxID=1630135 RepID=A0ABX6A7G2_9MICO|nr:dihydrofolate reductase family protein [Dermabacter vaginalis]QEU12080.1 pyrimidine reductase [Dermabacter vaginalis]